MAGKYSVGMPADTEAFRALLLRMTGAICAADGVAAAACFTPEGVYHDGFYGEFKGRERIARMVTGYFHRDGRDFAWELQDTLADATRGFARYAFSYKSRIAGSEGREAHFTGIAFCELEGGLIRRYSEEFERAPALVQLGFSDERILKSVKKWGRPPFS